jgi:hypothetical protein
VPLRIIEASAAGLAYGAGLCWVGASLVASFRPDRLITPYWSSIPRLRTDTLGIFSFIVLAVCFCLSEYLRIRRRADRASISQNMRPTGSFVLLANAFAKTIALLGSALVIYISLNAVTHPATLDMPATHLAGWPTEGTLRVSFLIASGCAIGVLRYLMITGSSGT